MWPMSRAKGLPGPQQQQQQQQQQHRTLDEEVLEDGNYNTDSGVSMKWFTVLIGWCTISHIWCFAFLLQKPDMSNISRWICYVFILYRHSFYPPMLIHWYLPYISSSKVRTYLTIIELSQPLWFNNWYKDCVYHVCGHGFESRLKRKFSHVKWLNRGMAK